ncbi:unnamed protein product [Albugo candida]|uniref:Uncharacterized protein n=1 Tax=Albugo candida TaxID=65357 RepID=A0A024GIA0_9STRA|nr:unnamed protein product [Albugo candida]|eukprot:CCI46480.1 unnamed protein product [Albugo candida]
MAIWQKCRLLLHSADTLSYNGVNAYYQYFLRPQTSLCLKAADRMSTTFKGGGRNRLCMDYRKYYETISAYACNASHYWSRNYTPHKFIALMRCAVKLVI